MKNRFKNKKLLSMGKILLMGAFSLLFSSSCFAVEVSDEIKDNFFQKSGKIFDELSEEEQENVLQKFGKGGGPEMAGKIGGKKGLSKIENSKEGIEEIDYLGEYQKTRRAFDINRNRFNRAKIIASGNSLGIYDRGANDGSLRKDLDILQEKMNIITKIYEVNVQEADKLRNSKENNFRRAVDVKKETDDLKVALKKYYYEEFRDKFKSALLERRKTEILLSEQTNED